MIAIRSIITIAAGALVLASCASALREDATDGDRQVDELGTIPQLSHSAVCSGGRWSCTARVRTDVSNHIKPFVTPQGFGPADLASAYKLDPAKTSTATIAIVDAFAYPNAASDLATYRAQFGLPPCTVANGCLIINNSQGAGNAPAGDDWTVEAALDLDMASAACPTCKLVLVEAKDDQGSGLFTAQNTAAALAGVVAISNSWGGPSDGTDVSLDS
jgi:subtilase family serine protease